MLCEFHHHLVHEGAFTITGDPTNGTIDLTKPGDAPRGEQPTSNPDRLIGNHRRHGFRPTHDRTHTGDRPDYDYIAAVVAERRRYLNPST